MTTHPEQPTDADLLAYMEVLHESEVSGARSEVVFGPYTAMLIIGALQLATRHPGMTDHQRGEILTIVDQFRPWFVGTPGEYIIDRGNRPEHEPMIEWEDDVEYEADECTCDERSGRCAIHGLVWWED